MEKLNERNHHRHRTSHEHRESSTNRWLIGTENAYLRNYLEFDQLLSVTRYALNDAESRMVKRHSLDTPCQDPGPNKLYFIACVFLAVARGKASVGVH
jgi:hypothetical protein